MQTIRPEIVKQLKKSSKARYLLAYLFDIHPNNISRMLENEDIRLTTPTCLAAIATELGYKKSELLTEK